MTNTVATIAVVLATNITQIGTFHSDKWGDFKVMEHKLQTNTVVMVEFEGGIKTFVLKSVDGPILKEERVSSQSSYILTTNGYSSVWTNFLINDYQK